MPLPAAKTRPTAEARSKKSHYRLLPKEFRGNGFTYRQIARESEAAIYEHTWIGCAEPNPCYEAIRIRRREGFHIDGRFVEPAEVYPNSEAWGVNGFTFTDRDKAWAKFSEISLEEPARTGKEVKMRKSYRKFVGNAKYLKKEDIPSPVNTSILWIKEEEVTTPGKGTETRLVLYFDGLKKGLVLNTVNAEALAEITGTDDYEQWSDIPVQLYADPDVTFGKKKVGGIRIRKPGSDTDTVPVPVQEPELVQIPF